MPRTLIIAEAGVNHNGSLSRALEMVDAAAEAGANVVKFQTWKTENVITRCAPKADYQMESTGLEQSLFDMLKQLELSYEDFTRIHEYCTSTGIAFLSTADEIESAIFLNSLQHLFKVGSAELTDLPYLRKLAAFGKPIILSTGMGTLDEIQQAIDVLSSHGLSRTQITVLHCTTSYPAPYGEVNLAAMLTIRERLQVRVGYSDHTLGIEVPIAAVALGAEVIEKHFTLDKTLPGPDHAASVEPHELGQMIRSIRHIEAALGDGCKKPSPAELQNMSAIRKSIVASKSIRKGEVFTEGNLTAKRPGTGLPPSLCDRLIGQIAGRDYSPDEMIEL